MRSLEDCKLWASYTAGSLEISCRQGECWPHSQREEEFAFVWLEVMFTVDLDVCFVGRKKIFCYLKERV
jgi:hypothetical protein